MENVMLNNIGKTILNYGVFLAAVGTVVMALQEVVKSVLHARRWFNKKEFGKWLGKNEELRKEFLVLTTGGYESEKALFDQPVEKMMGQIQSAANMAIDFPERYPHIYAFLAEVPEVAGKALDRETWKKFAAKKHEGTMTEADREESSDAAKARARLGNLVARKLDAFQNETQFAWADWNQGISVLFSAILIVIVLQKPLEAVFPVFGFVMAVPIGLAGGAVAPFAKDVVNSLSQFGKGK